jgi:endonuclease/exonuclease/phosphatase (EEP) superfamily protein YafD
MGRLLHERAAMRTTIVLGCSLLLLGAGCGGEPDGIEQRSQSVAYGPVPSIPGTVYAENYDLGGEGVGYHDREAQNLGGAFRTSEGVDVANSAGAGLHVGWLDVGDWMNYTVDVTTPGKYTLELRYAANNPPAAPRAEVTFGSGPSVYVDMGNTGGWDSWKIAQASVVLDSGSQVMKVRSVVDYWNLDTITLELVPSTPYASPPPTIPGTISAERYDLGGEGVGYHDREAQNLGGAFRTSEGVDVANSSGAGLHVGWLDVGDWMKYTVNVTTAGSYTLKLRYASNSPPATPKAEVRFGSSAPVTISLSNTGGWDTWQTAQTTISLSAGIQVVTVRSLVDYWNLDTITLESASAPPPPPPPPAGGGTLRVVSWNLQHANCPSCQATKLHQQNPHLIMLQEAPGSAVQTIRNQLQSLTGVSWTSSDANGVALMTRQTLLEAAENRYLGPTKWSSAGRWGVRMKLDVGGVPVQVFGTHLDWYYDEYADHVTSRNSFLSWIDSVSGKKIAGGDLNAWTWGSSQQIATIAGFDQRLVDVCSSMLGSHSICNDVRTNFSSNGGSWRPDYIYRSSGTSPLSYQVVDRAGLSDHQLLVAEIGVNP